MSFFLFKKYNLWLFLNVSCNLFGANHWFAFSLFWTLWQERSEAEMCLGGLEKAVTAPQHAISTLCKSQELEMQLSFRGCVPRFYVFGKCIFKKIEDCHFALRISRLWNKMKYLFLISLFYKLLANFILILLLLWVNCSMGTCKSCKVQKKKRLN